MNWLLIAEVAYLIIVILVCLRVIYDTRSNTKTLAYLLMIIFVPVLGIFIYFSFGINYSNRKMYSRKLIKDEALQQQVIERIRTTSLQTFKEGGAILHNYPRMFRYLLNEGQSALVGHNEVEILINGENKFPRLLEELRKAKKFIHIEYYIYENDHIGNAIADILIEKVKEGVEVRFIYDDFGSHSIRKKFTNRLRENGVQAFPFYKIIFIAFANRLNYRNHRKIIVIDGGIGFVGGINVSDKYINDPQLQIKLYWRDTHLMIKGPGVYFLQRLFIADWNFCAADDLEASAYFFPNPESIAQPDNKLVQIAASGPDSDNPTILYSLIQAISSAKKELLITTPYFIPGEGIMESLTVAAYSGVKVKLLIPGISDSLLVNTAAYSFYEDLLKAGVEIYRYQKGFVHAKTLVCDRAFSIVGTANMDHRSFELNFEVNAVVYDETIAQQLAAAYENDLKNSEQINAAEWFNRPAYKKLFEKTCRLVSPLL